MSKKKPKENESQEIGRLAGRALSAAMPQSWIELPTDGDADFGIDYLIHLKSENNDVIGPFFLQLKGTKNPRYVNGGEEISHSFNRSTLNYYEEQQGAVMVAVADLSRDPHPKNCPVFYGWIDEIGLASGVSGGDKESDTVTLRLSTSNRICESVDVLSYFINRLNTHQALQDLRRSVDLHSSDDSIKAIRRVAEVIRLKPAILELQGGDDDAPWVCSPKDTASGKLKILSDNIHAYRIEQAENLIGEIEHLDLSGHHRAELFYQNGRLRALLEEHSEALRLYELAFQSAKLTRYRVAYYEQLVREKDALQPSELCGILKDLSEENLPESLVKAKILALQGDKDGALSVLSKFPEEKTLVTRISVLGLTSSFSEIDELFRNFDMEKLDERSRAICKAFRARRMFYRAINEPSSAENVSTIPASGKESYNYELLKDCHRCLKEVMADLERSGNSRDMVVFLDLCVCVFSMLHLQDDLIEYLERQLSLGISVASFTSALVPLKFNSGDFEGVIELFERSPAKSLEELIISVMANYHLGRNPEVIKVMDAAAGLLVDQRPLNWQAAVCAASASAYELLDLDKEKEYLELLQDEPDRESYLRIYEFFKQCNENPDKRRPLLKKLYDDSSSNGVSPVVAQQMLSYLDPNEDWGVSIIPELVRAILQVRSLSLNEKRMLAFSLLKTEDWVELNQLCESVIQARGYDDFWCLHAAAALDGMGRVSEAMDLLDADVSRDARSVERAENFVNLSMRTGFFDRAERKLSRLLGGGSIDKQISSLRSLIFIYSADESPQNRLVPALLKYGNLVDPSNEEQEAGFLSTALLITSRSDVDLAENSADIRDRLTKFLERFPQSRYLRSGSIAEEQDSQAIIDSLKRIAGIDSEKEAQFEKNKIRIRSRSLPVPFSSLSAFLHDVNDVYHCWLVGKHADRKAREYLLRHSSPVPQSDFRHAIGAGERVVLEETSLVVLNEIGLLGRVLDRVPNLIIPKAIIASISSASHPMMGSLAYGTAREILSEITPRIGQLTASGPPCQNASSIDFYRAILEEDGPAILCTDDANLALFVRHLGGQVCSSMNLLEMLFDNGALNASEVSELVVELCKCPIEEPCIPKRLILSTFDEFLASSGPDSILDSEFRLVFEVACGASVEREVALHLLAEMLVRATKLLPNQAAMTGLGAMVDAWVLRHQGLSRMTVAAALFVMICEVLPVEKEFEFIGVGKYHPKALSLVMLVARVDSPQAQEKLFRAIAGLVVRMPPEAASDLYEKTCLAFVSGSPEQEIFSRIYSDAAVEARLAAFQN